REKLTQSLIADRVNARHTDEQLRAGFPAVSPAPPPPPAPSMREPSAAPAPPAGPAPISTAAPTPEPAAISGAAASAGRAVGYSRSAPGQGLRKQGEPPEPGPIESSLEVPQARAAPA